MAKFVQNISFLQDIPGFVSFICANMNMHKNMCHAKMYAYKSFLQDGDILVVVLIGVDAVDNTSGHILAVQLWGWSLSLVIIFGDIDNNDKIIDENDK